MSGMKTRHARTGASLAPEPDVLVRIRQLRCAWPYPAGRGLREALFVRELDVRRGEILAVTGPSGSGKSTLINLVAGFVPPSSGELLYRGAPVRGSGPDRVVVFQNHALFPWLTAFENVAYGLRIQKVPGPEIRQRVEEALALTGLSDFARACPAALSGGMCQRVALARALVLRPAILLLDEPFASLDAVNRSLLQDEVLRLWQRFRWTIVQVTHRVEEAVLMADRVALLLPPPQGLVQVTDIGLARPRTPDSPEVQAGTRALTQALTSACARQAAPTIDPL